ncbi:MAG: Hpt domain-containing protein, partial [Pseudomonas sp.]
LNVRLASVMPANVQVPLEEGLLGQPDDVDLTNLHQLTRGDDTSIRSLLGDLSASNNEDMARLMKLFARHDVSGLSNLAHRVKGGARIIKAQGLITACDFLEAACSGLDPAQLTEAVDALHQAMERLAERLEPYTPTE